MPNIVVTSSSKYRYNKDEPFKKAVEETNSKTKTAILISRLALILSLIAIGLAFKF